MAQVVQDRAFWREGEKRFVQQVDLPWASGRQLMVEA